MSKLGDAGYPQGNALFPTSVGSTGDKPVGYVEQGAETTVFVKTTLLPGGIEFLAGTDAVISSGTATPNDADGKPDGSIYFQI